MGGPISATETVPWVRKSSLLLPAQRPSGRYRCARLPPSTFGTEEAVRLHAVAASIAEDQLGLVARRQLLEVGVHESTVDAAVRRRHLVPEARGVYRLPGAPVTPEVRLLAHVLAAGPGALLSHRSAAWLWDLAPVPDRHHVTVPRGRRPRAGTFVVHESSDLPLAIPGTVHGLPVTGVGRTILDCAGDPSIDVQLLIDAARRVRKISRTLLPSTVVAHACSGRSGIRRLGDLIAFDEMPHSDFERLVCRWLLDLDFTGWELHHRIVVPVRGPIEIDIAWPDLRVAFELEGADHRDRSIVHDDDTERQNWISIAGWHVVRTTYRRWVRHTGAVLAELAAALDLATVNHMATPPLPRARVPSPESATRDPAT
jgi:very-short-patch-repair endonuclease